MRERLRQVRMRYELERAFRELQDEMTREDEANALVDGLNPSADWIHEGRIVVSAA